MRDVKKAPEKGSRINPGIYQAEYRLIFSLGLGHKNGLRAFPSQRLI